MRPAYSLAAENVPRLGSPRGGALPPGAAAQPLPKLRLTLPNASGFHVGQINARHAHGAQHGRNRLHHRQSVHVVAAVHAVNMRQGRQ